WGLWLPERAAAARRDPRGTYGRARLAYRAGAAATNRLTLIAAVLPAGVVTTHTLFCLRQALDDDRMQFLCGLFNSFVTNYLVRLRVGTHVTAAIVERLRVPRPAVDSEAFRDVVALSRALASAGGPQAGTRAPSPARPRHRPPPAP